MQTEIDVRVWIEMILTKRVKTNGTDATSWDTDTKYRQSKTINIFFVVKLVKSNSLWLTPFNLSTRCVGMMLLH